MMNNLLVWLYSSCLLTPHILSEKVVLRDNRGNYGTSLAWVRKPFPSHSCAGSWTLEDNNWYTCFARNTSKQKCLLETSTYYLRNLVNSAYLNISVRTDSCKKKKVFLSTDQPCIDFMTLRYIKSQSKKVTKPEDFIILDKLPGVDIVGNNTHYISQDLFTINVKNTAYIKFGFDAENYCGEIISFEVFYYHCPSKTEELVDLSLNATPSEGEPPVTIQGKCAANSVPDTQQNITNPYIKCHSNGSYEVFGKCRCNAGYFKKEKQCQACGSSGFKLKVGNEACTSCGKYSFSTFPHKSCVCDMSYFREVGKTQDSAADCYQPPSKPQGIETKNITSNSVKFEWKAPKHGVTTGENTDYVIDCIKCSVNDKFPLRTKQTAIMLANLGSFAPYTLKVSMQNTITKKVNVVNAEEVSFKTLVGKPGKVEKLKRRFQAEGSAVIEWEAPFSKGAADLSYRVTYGSKSVTTRKPSITIESKDETHQIKVYAVAKTSTGEIFVGEPQTITVKTSGGVDVGATIGAVVGVMVLLVIVFIVFLHFWRKRHPMYTQVVRLEDGTVKMNGGTFLQREKSYVDPTTYNDVDDAVKEFAKEVKKQDLEIGTLIGGGSFWDLSKGKLTKNGKVIDVAIKQLKPLASKEDRDNFLNEAAILGQFSHKNVIQLEGFVKQEGCSTSQTTSYFNTENTISYENQTEIRLIVLEYMKKGTLETFLQQNKTQFAVLELLGMARDVSNGMKYLSEMGFIHRDLTARNILVDKQRTCKVADFGGIKIPIRWTAPEAIEYRQFTSASDVWSFGILLWEIMSFGQRPYAELTNGEVLKRINHGYRLPSPMNCPIAVHNLMLECWSRDRLKRPKFCSILTTLENWIRNPATSEIGVSAEHKYAGNILEKGYATPRQIVDLNLEDLEELGVGPIGHREIFKGMQKTKGQQLYYEDE